MYVNTWVALAKPHDCIVWHIIAAAQAQHLEARQALEKQLNLQARAPDDLAKAVPHAASWHQHAAIA